PESRLIEHQQPRVDRQDERQMQLRDHALVQLADACASGNLLAEKYLFGALAVEARMHALDVIDRMIDAQQARQHAGIGDEADLAHEGRAIPIGLQTEDAHAALIGRQPENGLQQRRLARAIAADQADDAAGTDPQAYIIQRAQLAVALAEMLDLNEVRHHPAPASARPR